MAKYKFNTSKGIFDYILSRPIPTYITPANIQKTYQTALNSYKLYQQPINASLKKLSTYQPAPNTPQYKALVDMYNREYERNAALAAAETIAASNAADAGYGNTYSKAATNQAFSNYMASRGADIPSLLASAGTAYQNDRAAIANGISAMTNSRNLKESTYGNVLSRKLSADSNRMKSKQNAYNTLINSLTGLYSQKLSEEEAAAREAAAREAEQQRSSVSRRGGSGRKKRYYGGGNNSGGGNKETTTTTTKPLLTTAQLNSLYKKACKEVRGLSGMLMPPSEYARSHNLNDYASYVESQIKKKKWLSRHGDNRGNKK